MKINYIIEDKYDNVEIRDILRDRFGMSNNMIKRVKLYGKMDINGVHTRVIDKVKAGVTGSGMTWSASGEVSKAPRAVVIKNGVYVTP